jgi:predicted transcriptional regulator
VADELSNKDGERLDSRFKDFIDRVIVPILVKEYLAQSRQLAEEQAKSAHRSNLSSLPSQAERRPRVSDEKQMLTVTEAAAALGVKEATVRAWVGADTRDWLPGSTLFNQQDRKRVPSTHTITARQTSRRRSIFFEN